MTIDELINVPAGLAHGQEPLGAVILSSRIRLARNLGTYPFPGWASAQQKREIFEKCSKIIAEIAEMQPTTVLEIEELQELEQQVLIERHLMSRELSESGEGAGLIVNKTQSCSIMINEEDHLRIQVLQSGFKLEEIWATIDAIDSAIEAKLDYAFSNDLGYLTACPTNVGTGLRASVMLHLPGLVISEQMEKIIRASNQLGLAVRGVLGEGSEASGSVFQISNQQTLGESEESIIHRLVHVLESIIEHENNARMKLLEDQPRKVMDKISRAYGTLKNAYILSSSEAMNLLSLSRLAIDLDMLPEEQRGIIDRLFIECQPGHVQYLAHKNIDTDERDERRADYLRSYFQNISAPVFDKCPKGMNN